MYSMGGATQRRTNNMNNSSPNTTTTTPPLNKSFTPRSFDGDDSEDDHAEFQPLIPHPQIRYGHTSSSRGEKMGSNFSPTTNQYATPTHTIRPTIHPTTVISHNPTRATRITSQYQQNISSLPYGGPKQPEIGHNFHPISTPTNPSHLLPPRIQIIPNGRSIQQALNETPPTTSSPVTQSISQVGHGVYNQSGLDNDIESDGSASDFTTPTRHHISSISRVQSTWNSNPYSPLSTSYGPRSFVSSDDELMAKVRLEMVRNNASFKTIPFIYHLPVIFLILTLCMVLYIASQAASINSQIQQHYETLLKIENGLVNKHHNLAEINRGIDSDHSTGGEASHNRQKLDEGDEMVGREDLDEANTNYLVDSLDNYHRRTQSHQQQHSNDGDGVDGKGEDDGEEVIHSAGVVGVEKGGKINTSISTSQNHSQKDPTSTKNGPSTRTTTSTKETSTIDQIISRKNELLQDLLDLKAPQLPVEMGGVGRTPGKNGHRSGHNHQKDQNGRADHSQPLNPIDTELDKGNELAEGESAGNTITTTTTSPHSNNNHNNGQNNGQNNDQNHNNNQSLPHHTHKPLRSLHPIQMTASTTITTKGGADGNNDGNIHKQNLDQNGQNGHFDSSTPPSPPSQHQPPTKRNKLNKFKHRPRSSKRKLRDGDDLHIDRDNQDKMLDNGQQSQSKPPSFHSTSTYHPRHNVKNDSKNGLDSEPIDELKQQDQNDIKILNTNSNNEVTEHDNQYDQDGYDTNGNQYEPLDDDEHNEPNDEIPPPPLFIDNYGQDTPQDFYGLSSHHLFMDSDNGDGLEDGDDPSSQLNGENGDNQNLGQNG